MHFQSLGFATYPHGYESDILNCYEKGPTGGLSAYRQSYMGWRSQVYHRKHTIILNVL
jgi:hypothetical protein